MQDIDTLDENSQEIIIHQTDLQAGRNLKRHNPLPEDETLVENSQKSFNQKQSQKKKFGLTINVDDSDEEMKNEPTNFVQSKRGLETEEPDSNFQNIEKAKVGEA